MHKIDISPQQISTIDLAISQAEIGVGAVGVRAVATAWANAPVVIAVINSTVTAVVATSNAVAVVPFSAGGANAAFVNAIRAQATANAYAPVFSGGVAVIAVVATATAKAMTVVNPVNASVVAVIAGSTSLDSAPIIDAETVVSGGGPGTASALAYPPTVSVTTSAPVFGSAGARLIGGTGTACNFPVPAGVAANDIIMVFLYCDPDTDTVTPAAGFAQASASPVVLGTGSARWYAFWKRASGADSGTYNFTLAVAASYREGVAARYTGCVTSGNPFDTGTGAPVGGTSPGGDVSYPNTTLTTIGPNRLILWAGGSASPTITTQPSGYAKDFEDFAEAVEMCLASTPQGVAGSTGTLSATVASGTNGKAVWLGALLPA